MVTAPPLPDKKLYNGGSEMQNDFVDLPNYYQTFFRNYDAALGRWIGVDLDPESAESLTVYQYAGNNPVMFNDPLGDKLNADDWDIIKYFAKNGVPKGENYHYNSATGSLDVMDDANAFIAGANYMNNLGGWGQGNTPASYYDAAVTFNIRQGFSANTRPVDPFHMSGWITTTHWYRNADGSNAIVNGVSSESVMYNSADDFR